MIIEREPDWTILSFLHKQTFSLEFTESPLPTNPTVDLPFLHIHVHVPAVSSSASDGVVLTFTVRSSSFDGVVMFVSRVYENS